MRIRVNFNIQVWGWSGKYGLSHPSPTSDHSTQLLKLRYRTSIFGAFENILVPVFDIQLRCLFYSNQKSKCTIILFLKISSNMSLKFPYVMNFFSVKLCDEFHSRNLHDKWKKTKRSSSLTLHQSSGYWLIGGHLAHEHMGKVGVTWCKQAAPWQISPRFLFILLNWCSKLYTWLVKQKELTWINGLT
jgi:hypothetical protein